MNDFKTCFENKKAFVGYLTAGHQGLDYTRDAAIALCEGGVNILEIGIPFSDPIADGSVIQAAMADALSRGVTLKAIFKTIRAIKKAVKVPIVLFSYLNPLLRHGLSETLQSAKQAGVSGMLVVDLPFEESSDYFQACKAHGLLPVGLISQTTPLERVKEIQARCQAFLYYVCRSGTTGVKSALPLNYAEKMQAIHSVSTLPVVCGFGIGDKETAQAALAYAEGFVVGSAFVKAIHEGKKPDYLKQFAAQFISQASANTKAHMALTTGTARIATQGS